jgi:hypothetical protein
VIVSNFTISSRWHLRTPHDTRYELQITNLADKEIEFTVECHTCPPPSHRFHRWYLDETVQVSVSSGLTGSTFFRRYGDVWVMQTGISIGTQCSVLYGLSKNDREIRDDEEIRGFVTLRVPPANTSGRGYFRDPQSHRPVKVLLHARRRDSRLGFSVQAHHREGWYSEWSLPFPEWYSSEAVTLSTGKAENDIRPEGGFDLARESLRYAL